MIYGSYDGLCGMFHTDKDLQDDCALDIFLGGGVVGTIL